MKDIFVRTRSLTHLSRFSITPIEKSRPYLCINISRRIWSSFRTDKRNYRENTQYKDETHLLARYEVRHI